MKKLLLTLALLVASFTGASAQCNGVFPNNTICGNVSGASAVPRAVPNSVLTGVPGGTNGQIQYNNNGTFGGRNPSGNGTTVGTTAGTLTAGHCVEIDASGNLVDSGAICGAGAGSSFDAASYGAVCNGVADDTTALSDWVTAINASSAASAYATLPGGNCRINSAALPTGYVFTRGNVEVDGRGTTLTVFGAASIHGVFNSADQSYMTYRRIKFVGNNVTSGTGFGIDAAIRFNNTNAYTTNLLVEDCHFDNFAGNYWIFVETLGTFANAIENININRNFFISRNGNCFGPTNIAINCSFVLVYGVGHDGVSPTPDAYIQGVRVTNNTMYANFMKTGIQIFNNVQDAVIEGNFIYNAGLSGGITDDHGSYAIMIYENPTAFGRRIMVTNNYIYNSRDNAIYVAGNTWTDSIFLGNIIDGVTSTSVATLPKGGITILGCLGCTVSSNRIKNVLADGITLIAPAASTPGYWIVNHNRVDGGINAMRMVNNSGGTISRLEITDNIFEAINLSSSGLLVYVFPGSSYFDFKIDGNVFLGGAYGLRFVPDSGSITMGNVAVINNIARAQATSGFDVSQTIGGPLLLANNQVSGAMTASYNITNTVNGIFQNNVVSGNNTGVGWTTAGAQGSMQNNTFNQTPNANIVAALGVTDLGRVVPTFTPSGSGDFLVVQKLNPVEAGAAASKYLLREWMWTSNTGSWLEQRQLTGN